MNHKATVAGVAIAVLLMLCAGVGYALTYTGTTSNTGNEVVSTYIVVGQDGYTDKFDATVYYDTVKTSSTTTYTLNTATPGYAADADGAGTVITGPTVKIGTVTLTITEEANATGGRDSYTLAVTHDKTITGTYYMSYKVGDAAVVYKEFSSTALAGATTDSITGAASTTVVVDIYLGVSTTGVTSPPAANPVDDVTFTFTASAATA